MKACPRNPVLVILLYSFIAQVRSYSAASIGTPCGSVYGSYRYMVKHGNFGCYQCESGEYWSRWMKECRPCLGFLTNKIPNIRTSCKDIRIPPTTSTPTVSYNTTQTALELSNNQTLLMATIAKNASNTEETHTKVDVKLLKKGKRKGKKRRNRKRKNKRKKNRVRKRKNRKIKSKNAKMLEMSTNV